MRDANGTLDAGDFRAGNAAEAQELLAFFDSIFDVLKPSEREGGLSDADVDALIAERGQAKKAKNFKRSDEIRDELSTAGIILEDTKEGVRWKRKS